MFDDGDTAGLPNVPNDGGTGLQNVPDDGGTGLQNVSDRGTSGLQTFLIVGALQVSQTSLKEALQLFETSLKMEVLQVSEIMFFCSEFVCVAFGEDFIKSHLTIRISHRCEAR